MKSQAIIEIQNLSNKLGGQWIHKHLNLDVQKGEILGIVGGSGTGKTTLLRCILKLIQPTSGTIKVFGTDIGKCSHEEVLAIQRRWGMLFQQNALFSSLTVLENVQFPLRTFTDLPHALQEKIALLKIAMVGLPVETAAFKYPAELSGGMRKRAALARSISMDPELLFLDEPTSGLDPKSAKELDELILDLRKGLGLTVVVVSHDIDALARICDRVAFLADQKVVAALPLPELIKRSDPAIQDFFKGFEYIVQPTLSERKDNGT